MGRSWRMTKEERIEYSKQMERRWGRLVIDDSFLRYDSPLMQMVMSRMVVTECTHHYMTDELDYNAISPEFDVVGPGEQIPEYHVVIDEDAAWERKIRFERKR